MSSTLVATDDWSRGRWWGMIVLLFLLHGGVIFWLSFRRHNSATAIQAAPPVHIAAVGNAEWPDITSASQFVLANQHGFSRKAWLEIPSLEYDLPEWTEPALPLALSVNKLGGALAEFTRSDFGSTLELTPIANPQMESVIASDPVASIVSRLTFGGGLVSRTLVSPVTLNAWPAADILTNSIVQTGVDDKGTVVSAVLLGGSGSPKADARALALARSARFEPLNPSRFGRPSGVLTWGTMIFRWQTVALPATNAATINGP